MAIVLATVSLDMSNLNFNAGLSSDNSTLFYDNQPFTSDGFIYMDTVRVISDGGTRYSDYAGPELWHDPYSGMSGGLITGIFAGAYSTGNQLVIQGIALPVADLGSATATSATTDDFAVFASIFAGSDLFSLSDAGDVAYGFSGKDSIYGFGGHDWLYGLHGNDLLRGHDGSDLLDGGQGRDKLTGGRGNDVFQFTVLKDGAIRLPISTVSEATMTCSYSGRPAFEGPAQVNWMRLSFRPAQPM